MTWSRFFRRDEADAEQRQELESYLEITTEEYVAQGMEPKSARQAAMRKLGNTTRIREEIYSMNTLEMLDTVFRHTRFTLRSLRQNPTFAVISILTLAVGIGANTAVFSVVNSVLLKPLPYPDSDRLVDLHQEAPGAGALVTAGDGFRLSRSMYFTYAEQNRSFQAMGVWSAGIGAVTGLGEPERIRIISVSDGTLEAPSEADARSCALGGGSSSRSARDGASQLWVLAEPLCRGPGDSGTESFGRWPPARNHRGNAS
jgi:putative ABC transport system permease protein